VYGGQYSDALLFTVRFQSLPARLAFYSLFSLGFLLFCHGSTIAFMLIIVGINFAIGWIGSVNEGRLGTPATAATWIFNCLILLANERYRGYSWHDVLAFGGSDLAPLATWLQSQRGLFPWQGLFNMVVLRMISFNLDRIWCSQARPTLERDGSVLTFGKHQGKCTEGCKERGKEGPCPWWREKEHHRAVDYTFLPYFCYLFYVPLHFAGPTMTFNSWLSCVKTPQQTYSRAGLVKYTLLRVAFIFLVLEWWLHYCYVFTLTNHKPTFLSLSPYAMAIVSYFTLIGIWLKFTAIWRFFRGWALLDGIEPPENMQRCVSNNYSIQSFWRAWHRSFNRWLVRYIYIPLGGGASASTSPPSLSTKLLSVLRQSFNVFLTFSFVAFWHDRTMQLLAWGWLIAVLFVPELTASAVFHMKSLRSMRSRWYARHLRGVGAALSIFMMMVANLIGYSVGIDGVNGLMQTMVEQGGVTMFVVIFTAFFSAAMVMFEFRETGITVD
jgi:D-alanyl-lipoteichoic acid acyltransferase DltB (MBOAT superfamily)